MMKFVVSYLHLPTLLDGWLIIRKNIVAFIIRELNKNYGFVDIEFLYYCILSITSTYNVELNTYICDKKVNLRWLSTRKQSAPFI